MKFLRCLFVVSLIAATQLLASLPAAAQSGQSATILNITPVPNACVLRSSADPTQRRLVIMGNGFPSPRTTQNIQFRRADGGGESIYIGMEVTWTSANQVSVDDIASISQFLWPTNNRLFLEVRFTRDDGTGAQVPISDWSTARFILAKDATACNQLPTFISVNPVSPACVLRSGTSAQTTLTLNGQGLPSARLTENLRFRQQDGAIFAVSNPIGLQITWTSDTQIAVNMANLPGFLWPQNSRVTLQAQLTTSDVRLPGMQVALSDWSPPFIIAKDTVACNDNLDAYQVTTSGFTAAQNSTALTAVRNTGNALRQKLASPDFSAADAFKRVMFATGRNQIQLVSGGNNAGCSTNNNVAAPLEATTTCGSATQLTQYTVVHELGHVLVGRTGGNAAGFYKDMEGASVSDTQGGTVFGHWQPAGVDDWTRGQRGWGSAGAPLPNPCNFQQNPYTNSAYSVDQKEVDEAAADMFLNWVYKKINQGGFQNTNWTGITNCQATGSPDGSNPGDARNNWMESELAKLGTQYWP